MTMDDVLRCDPETRRRRQLERLGRLLATVRRSNSFYRRKLADAGIAADAITSFDEYARLPFTTKQELSEDQQLTPPFGSNLSEPLDRYVRLHQTSGTKGRPLRWLDTHETWDWWTQCWATVFAAAGVTRHDRVFFAFSFGPFIGFWSAFAGAEALGCLVIPGGGMTSEQRLHTILSCAATVVVATPTYALHLGELARRTGLDLSNSGVKRTIHAGEPGAAIASTRARIESLWGAACFDHAGATEVGAWGFECEARAGLHLNEAEFVCEVLDPATGRAASEGELVITNLGRAAMPVIRYRTGDHVSVTSEPCACGRTTLRCRGGVIGRIDETLIVRGVNVFPSAIEEIVHAVPGIGEFQVEVTRRDELDEILLRIEPDGAANLDVKQLQRELRNQLGLRATVEAVPAGSLPRSELKSRRFIDRRAHAPSTASHS